MRWRRDARRWSSRRGCRGRANRQEEGVWARVTLAQDAHGRIVITDCDHPTIGIERAIFARAGYEVELAQCRTANEVVASGAGAVALLAEYAPITDAVLAALPSVRVIGMYGASLDNIELPAAARRGLRVVNVPDYGVDEVADHTVGLILALTRGIVSLDRAIHAGTWDFRSGGELRRGSGQQVGIIGLGRIGSAVARRSFRSASGSSPPIRIGRPSRAFGWLNSRSCSRQVTS